jgi:hypothetical protein
VIEIPRIRVAGLPPVSTAELARLWRRDEQLRRDMGFSFAFFQAHPPPRVDNPFAQHLTVRTAKTGPVHHAAFRVPRAAEFNRRRLDPDNDRHVALPHLTTSSTTSFSAGSLSASTGTISIRILPAALPRHRHCRKPEDSSRRLPERSNRLVERAGPPKDDGAFGGPRLSHAKLIGPDFHEQSAIGPFVQSVAG